MKEDTKDVDDESSTQLAQDSTIPEKSESTKKSALISQKSLESSNQPSTVHETFLKQNLVNEAKNKDQTIPQTDTETCLSPQIYETQSPTKTDIEEKHDTKIIPKIQAISKKVQKDYLKQKFFGIGYFTFHRNMLMFFIPNFCIVII